jgi:hypothetical protein
MVLIVGVESLPSSQMLQPPMALTGTELRAKVKELGDAY